MIPQENQESALKIGFLNTNSLTDQEIFLKYFDIVGPLNTTFNELLNELNIFS